MKTLGILVLLTIFSKSTEKILAEQPKDESALSFIPKEDDPNDIFENEKIDYETSHNKDDLKELPFEDKFYFDTQSQDEIEPNHQYQEAQFKEDSEIADDTIFEVTNVEDKTASNNITGVANTSSILSTPPKDSTKILVEVNQTTAFKKKMLTKENNFAKVNKVGSSQNMLNNRQREYKQTKGESNDNTQPKKHSWMDILKNIESMMPVLSNMISGGKGWMSNTLSKDVDEKSQQNLEERSDKIISPPKMFHPLRSLLPDHAHSAVMPPLQTDILSHTTDLPAVTSPISKQQQTSRRKKGRSWPMFQSNTQPKRANSFSFHSSIPAFLNALPFMSTPKAKASSKRSSVVPSRVHLPNYPIPGSIQTFPNSQQSNFTNLVYYASLPDSTLTSMEHHLAIVEVPKHAEGKIPLTSVHVIAPGSPANKGAKVNSLPFIPNEKKASEETPYVMVNSNDEGELVNVDPYLVIPYKDTESNFAQTEIKKIMLPLRRAPQVISDLKNSFNNLRMESSEISATYVKPGSNEMSTAEGFGPPKRDDVLKQQQKPSKTTIAEHYVPSAGYGSQTSAQNPSNRYKQHNKNKQADQVFKETNRIPTSSYGTPTSPPIVAQHDTSFEINKIPVNADSESAGIGKHKQNSHENNTNEKKLRFTNTNGETHQVNNKDQKKNNKHIGSQSAPQAVYLHPTQTQAISAHNSSVTTTLAKYWSMLQENIPYPTSVINNIPNPIELLEKSRSQLIKTFNKGMVEIPNFFEGVLEDIGSVLSMQNEIPSVPSQSTTLLNSDKDGNRNKRKPNPWPQGIQGTTRGQSKIQIPNNNNVPQKPTKFLKQVDDNEDQGGDSLPASQQWTPTQNKIRYSDHSHRGAIIQNKSPPQQIRNTNALKMSVPLVHEQMIHTKNTPITEIKAPTIGLIQKGQLEYSSNAIINNDGGRFEAAKIAKHTQQKDKIPPPSHRGSAAVRGNFLNEATNEQHTPNINTLANDPITDQVQQHNYIAHRPAYAGPTLVMFSLENAIPLVPANPSFDPIETSASEQLFAEATGTQQRFYKIQLNNSAEKRNKVPQRQSPFTNLGNSHGYSTTTTTTPATVKNLTNTNAFLSTSNTQTQPSIIQRLPTVTFSPTKFTNQQLNNSNKQTSRRNPTTVQTAFPPISYRPNQQHSFGNTNKPVRQWTPPSSVDVQQPKYAERFRDYNIQEPITDQTSANSEIPTETIENEKENALLDIQKNIEDSSGGQLEHYNNNPVHQNQHQSAHEINQDYNTQSPYHSHASNANDYQSTRPRYHKKRQQFRKENKQQTTNPPIAFFQSPFNSLLQPITKHNQTSTAISNNKYIQTSLPSSKLPRYPSQGTRRPTTMQQTTTMLPVQQFTTTYYQKPTEKITSPNNFMWMNKTNKEKNQAKPSSSPFGFNFSNPTPTSHQIRKINKRQRPRDVAEVLSSNWPSFNIKEPKVSIEEPKAIEVDIDAYVEDDQIGEFSEVSEVNWNQPWRPKNLINLNEERTSSTTTNAAEEELVTVMEELLELPSDAPEKQELPFNPTQERFMKIRSNKNNLLRYRRPQNSKVDNLTTNHEQDQTISSKQSILSQMDFKANTNANKENGRTPIDFLSRMRNRKRTSPMPEYKPTTTFATTEDSSNDATSLLITSIPSENMNNISTHINLHSQRIKPSKSTLTHNFRSPATLKSQPTIMKAMWQPTFANDEKKSQLESSTQSQMSQRKPVQSVLLQDAPKPHDNFDWEFSKMTLETTSRPTDRNIEINQKSSKEDSKLKRFNFNAENKKNYDEEFSFTSRKKQVQNSFANTINNKNNDMTSSDNPYNLFDVKKVKDKTFEESISFPTPRTIWKETRLPDVSMYHRNEPDIIKTPSYTSINIASGRASKR